VLRRQLFTGLKITIALLVLLAGVYPAAVWAVGQVAFKHQANGSLVTSGGKAIGSSLIGQGFADKDGNAIAKYFQPRPSAAGNGYDSTASGGSQLGPLNPKLIGFQPGVNALDLNGNASTTNPFATADDPYCVPTDKDGAAVTEPSAGQEYAKNPDGSYVCYSGTVPERVAAYRQLNGLTPNAPVPIDAVTASGSGLDPDISIANAMDQAKRVAGARGIPVSAVTDLIRSHTDGRGWGVLGEKTINVLDLNLALDKLHPSG
jgi:potassium-transporting ATPase KdpC subunit